MSNRAEYSNRVYIVLITSTAIVYVLGLLMIAAWQMLSLVHFKLVLTHYSDLGFRLNGSNPFQDSRRSPFSIPIGSDTLG